MWYLLICRGYPDWKRPRVETFLQFFASEEDAKDALDNIKMDFVEEETGDDPDDPLFDTDDPLAIFDEVLERSFKDCCNISPGFEWSIGEVKENMRVVV